MRGADRGPRVQGKQAPCSSRDPGLQAAFLRHPRRAPGDMGVAAAPESFVGSRRPEQVRDCDVGLPSLRLASPHKCLPGLPVAKRGQFRDRVRNRAREVSHLNGQLGADEDDVRLLTVPAIRDGRASTRKRVSNVGKQAQYRRGATAAELVWPGVLQYTPSVHILLVGATYRLGSTVLQA